MQINHDVLLKNNKKKKTYISSKEAKEFKGTEKDYHWLKRRRKIHAKISRKTKSTTSDK